MQDWVNNDQVIIERGDGVFLFDTNGNKYIDGVSSLWVIVHGHRNKEINRSIHAQLNKIAHSTMLGLGNVPSIELAEKLVEITPKGLEKVFYSDSGSTSVEIALKIAFQYWRQKRESRVDIRYSKTKFITLENAYHGDTIGSVSVGGMDLFHKIYKPLLFKSIKVRVGDVLQLEQVLKKRHHEIAAMIVEPLIQAAAGMLIMPKGYLKSVEKLCKKYNVLLICDEVATGFGRTVKMFACEHENIRPDIMCLAKGISGGYLPLAATMTTKKIFDAFLGRQDENKTFFHGHTYTGNPMACAAAVASLELFEKEKTILNLQPKIKFLSEQLVRLKKIPSVKEIRQLGFMVGIELDGAGGAGHKVILEARKRGAILRPLGNVIVLMPPLAITLPQLKKLIDITFESISSVS